MRFPLPARVGVAAAGFALVGSLITSAGTANAGTDDKKRQVDRQITSLQNDLEGTSAALTAAYLRLRAVQARLPAARAELARAQEQVQAARDRDAEIGRQLDVAQAQVGKAVDDLSSTATSTRATRAAIGSMARQAYQTGGVGELSVVLQAETADDFAQRIGVVDTAMQIQGIALAQLAVARAETTAKQARLVAVRQQVAALKAQAAANVVRAQAAAREAAAAKARLDVLVASQAQEVRAINARKAAERRRLDALEAQSRALQRQLAAIARAERAERARLAKLRSSRGSASPPEATGGASTGVLSLPVKGAWITSEFGMRLHPILKYWRLHAGMDLAASCGTPVYAPAAGRIVSAGWAGSFGNRVVLSHGIVRGVGLSTTFNHMQSIATFSGSVARGQLVGYVGTTGQSTGCHLHFETYENGTPVNPRRWL